MSNAMQEARKLVKRFDDGLEVSFESAFNLLENLIEEFAQSQSDLEQANKEIKQLKELEDHLNKRDMLTRKELETANNSIQILAEALDRCVLYTKQFAHLSLNDQEKYQELANQYLKEKGE